MNWHLFRPIVLLGLEQTANGCGLPVDPDSPNCEQVHMHAYAPHLEHIADVTAAYRAAPAAVRQMVERLNDVLQVQPVAADHDYTELDAALLARVRAGHHAWQSINTDARVAAAAAPLAAAESPTVASTPAWRVVLRRLRALEAAGQLQEVALPFIDATRGHATAANDARQTKAA